MPDDNSQLVRFRTLDGGEMARRAWGDDWGKRPWVYEFSNGRRFEETAELYVDPSSYWITDDSDPVVTDDGDFVPV